MSNERPSLQEMTLRQLRKIASLLSVSRYSRMRKTQLLDAIQQKEDLMLSSNQTTLNNISQTYNQINTVQEEQNMETSKFSINQDSPYISDKTTDAYANQEEQKVEAAKFDVGQDDLIGGPLSSVDDGMGELPEGYGQSKIVLMPRDPQWAYTYWDIPNEHKEDLRRQGGQQLSLRLYDVTDINLEYESPHNVQEYLCDELAREWYLPIPVSDRDYVIDIGYRCFDGRWLVLARSVPVRIPPVYPSDWVEDIFITVNWEDDLKGKTAYKLTPPAKKAYIAATSRENNPLYQQIFNMAEGAEAQRVAGSLFGSMQHIAGSMIPERSVSSFVFPSGAGMWAVPTASGAGLTMSGAGIGMLTMSGYGLGASASAAPTRPRQFWLVADAELIVYGATEPDATVTIGDRQIQLNPDGTFRFQMSFQDGLIDYPIKAVAVDGEQTRSIQMKFTRETPSRHTNTKEEAVLEWAPFK